MPNKPKGKKRKGKFRLSKNKPVRNAAPSVPRMEPVHNTTPALPPMEMEQPSKTFKVFSRIGKVLLYIAVPIITTLFGDKGLSMLGGISPKIVIALVLFFLCVYTAGGVWVLTGWLSKCQLFSTYKRRMVIVGFVIIAIIILPQTYFIINYFIRDLGSIEMAEFGNDSTQVLVHYGEISKEIVLTQTTVGELLGKPRAALNVNEQDILYIHTDGNKLYVDARLFGGYKKQSFINLSLARTKEFSIKMSNYFNTDVAGDIVRESLGGYIADNITVNKISEAILSPPMVFKNNNINNLPDGWKIDERATALEIRNENNIPILLLEYKSPYEITISGIFITSFGIMKIDNGEDAAFQFGSNLAEVGTYKVNNIFVHSFLDLFKSERYYDLYENYSRQGIFSTVIKIERQVCALALAGCNAEGAEFAESARDILSGEENPNHPIIDYHLALEYGDKLKLEALDAALTGGRYGSWVAERLTEAKRFLGLEPPRFTIHYGERTPQWDLLWKKLFTGGDE